MLIEETDKKKKGKYKKKILAKKLGRIDEKKKKRDKNGKTKESKSGC